MSHELPSFLIDAGELLQHVSRVVYRGSPLYYGRSSTNRYDDPAQAYGVLYLGRDLPTALMESVFHKHQWLADTKRSIALRAAGSASSAGLHSPQALPAARSPGGESTSRIPSAAHRPRDEATATGVAGRIPAAPNSSSERSLPRPVGWKPRPRARLSRN